MDEKLKLDHEKRLAAVEARAKSNTRRIDNMEKVTEAVHNMSETLLVMTNEMKHTNENVKEIKEKVEAIESEPTIRMREGRKAFFNAFLGAIGAAAAAAFFYAISHFIV